MAAHDRIVESIKLEDIFIAGNRRDLAPEKVAVIAGSIDKLGLRSPITVRFVERHADPVEGELEGAYLLVAGRHRLEAARSLGHACIDCEVVRWDERTARKWEIAENLHRSDLSELQRKEQVAEWVAIEEAEAAERISAQLEPKVGRPASGVKAAARELGIDRNEAQRSVKIASISEQAKKAAIAAHLDNNQSALMRIAASKPGGQVDKVREIAAERDARESARKAARSAVTVPLAAAPLDEADARERWLAQGMAWWNRGPEEWRNEFRDRIDTPIMDRRHG